mmetsp:Transcript_17743/g.30047  ORF Transcript_17743/g.30047 Transcript_17743/m.30047 type:complete len:294 (-) Transcript_17743:130-1011(-)
MDIENTQHADQIPLSKHDPKSEQAPGNANPVWEELSPMIWRNSIYSEEASSNCMGRLFAHEVKLFECLAKQIRETEGSKAVVIEVGMGTAELFAKVHESFDLLVGVDISQQFVDCAYRIHPVLTEKKDKVKLIQGNACELSAVLEAPMPRASHFLWEPSTTRITCMCMNTFGILPEHIRGEVISQMFKCSGAGGKLIIGCWYKDCLRQGYEEFYSQHPELCGECKESDFDFANGDFNCSSSDYSSHWWSQEELKTFLISNYPGDAAELKIEFKILGVGIFAICEIPAAAPALI